VNSEPGNETITAAFSASISTMLVEGCGCLSSSTCCLSVLRSQQYDIKYHSIFPTHIHTHSTADSDTISHPASNGQGECRFLSQLGACSGLRGGQRRVEVNQRALVDKVLARYPEEFTGP